MLKKVKSFSLVELLAVVFVMIILLSFTTQKFLFFNKFILKNEVDRIFTLFSYLQQKAITSNTQQEIIFNLQNDSYLMNLQSKENKLASVVRFGFLPNSYGPPSDPKKTIKDAITFKKIEDNKFKVTFCSDGKIETGSIYFVDKDYKYMLAITIPVSNVSYIRKYEYKNGKWLIR